MTKTEFEDAKAPEYRYIYTTGAFGAIVPNDARIIFYLDRLIPKTVTEGDKVGTATTSKIVRELQVEVHMSPQQFVNLWLWMTERISSYRETFPQFPLSIPEFKSIAEEVKKSKPDAEAEPKNTDLIKTE